MVQAFSVAWTESEVDALKRRVADCPLPPAPEGAGWALGCDRAFLERFRDHWLTGYDWRAAMADLNRYPQFLAEVDGQAIHFVHVESKAVGARPLLLTHGWPGSHYEFWGVIERLSDAGFDLVIPSLPGYAFSGKPRQPIGPKTTARLWDGLMKTLGYDQYLAQGGDWGALVTGQLGLNHADSVRGIHVNLAGLRSAEPAQNAAETEWMAKAGAALQRLGGYSQVQMMKPLSLGWLGAGNPLGQAAWILERFHDWADLSAGDLESVFGMDHLVTNVMLYAMTDSFASSLWFYHGLIREGLPMLPAGVRCEVPTGYADFPGDALMPSPPRSRIELCFNLVHWGDPGEGGHFAAMEKPALFANDVIEWAGQVWPAESK
jgi:pimeloyl-ACP methyl ester carboxylesterase